MRIRGERSKLNYINPDFPVGMGMDDKHEEKCGEKNMGIQ
jgi:hypothetical protein